MPEYAAVNRGNLAAQIAHAPGDAADLIVKLEAERDRYREDAEVMHRNYHHMREERDRLRTWISSARNALADESAMEEEIDSPANMAFAILNHALNQEDRGA